RLKELTDPRCGCQNLNENPNELYARKACKFNSVSETCVSDVCGRGDTASIAPPR
ncbi:hypothetical protein K0M31_015914, partial [Melipona bicolor]